MKREKNRFSWNVTGGRIIVDDKVNHEQHRFNTMEYPETIRQRIYDFGCKSLFQARASQQDQNAKMDFWRDLDEMFTAGQWEQESKRGAFVVAPWVEALAEHKGCTISQLQTALAKYDKEAKANLRKNVEAKFAKEIKAIQDDRGEEVELDLDDLTEEEED